MIFSKGKNNYPNNEFDYWEWSAPVLQTHDEVTEIADNYADSAYGAIYATYVTYDPEF